MFTKIFGLLPIMAIVCAVALACSSESPEIVEVEKVIEVEVVKEVEVPGKTVVVEKEVVKEVEVPGETIVVEKEVVKQIQVPGETVVVEKEVGKRGRGREDRRSPEGSTTRTSSRSRPGSRSDRCACVRPGYAGCARPCRASSRSTSAPVPIVMGTPAGFAAWARQPSGTTNAPPSCVPRLTTFPRSASTPTAPRSSLL